MTEDLSTKPAWPKRLSVLILAFIAFVICYLDRVNISIAAITMQQEMGWTDVTKGYVFSFFFWGYLVMQVGGGYLSNRFGGKLILGWAVVFWSIFTVLTPAAAFFSIPALLAVRFLMGVGEAGLAPSSFTIVGRWFPHNEQSRVMSFLSSGAIFGTVLALLLAPKIIAAFNWQMVFYSFGALGFIWAVFWYFLVTDQPDHHPGISDYEKNLIAAGGGVKERAASVPWSKILGASPVWALCVTGFAASWTLYIFLSWLPSYFADVHGLNLSSAGLYALAPWVVMFLMLNVGGWIADTMITKGVSTTRTRKILIVSGFLGSAVFIIFLRGATTPELATVLMSAALGILALAYGGLVPNSLDIAPRFADIIYGTVNTFGTLAGALGAIAAGYIVQETGSYDNVFVVTAIISIVGAVTYLTLGSGKRIIE
ncbi:MAG: MFS transporter [Gammaproteobacteria bacterium]